MTLSTITSSFLGLTMCNLRVIHDTKMVTSAHTIPQTLVSKCYSAFSSKRPKAMSCQFSKYLSPKQQEKGLLGYQTSTGRSRSNPMIIPARTASSSQHGGGSGHGSVNRYRLPRPSSSFAGSKCFETPTPGSLPKPPIDWFAAAGGQSSS